jgi:two-component system, NtrC family, sensor kinase
MASVMSLTRKTSPAAKKHGKPGRQDLVEALAEREAELADARLQQAATAEVIKVIAASPTDVQPVFEAIAARANRLIGGYSTAVFRIFGDAVHLAAFTSVNAKADEALKAMFPKPRAQFPGLKSISRGDSAQVTDTELDGGVRDLARLRGYRSMLFTPLLSNGAPIGIISVTRQAPGAFSAHQVQLLQTFADQAVIAMNNVGLFNEAQEALKQQTATVEILKVIAGSPSDVNPVFEAVADRARDLLDCWSALVVRFDGEQAHFGAARGALPDTEQFVRQQYPTRPEPESTLGRCLLERTAVSHPNLQTGESPTLREYARTRGFRAVMSVPMLQDGRPIGAIIVTRQKAGDFTTRESALLQTFAAQAAIAIENTRLFNETKEALAQQTATADVLKVISRSAFDLQTVLDTLIASAVRLSGARGGAVCVREGDVFRFRAIVDPHPEVVRGIIGREVTPGRGAVAGRVLLSRKVEEIPDVKDLPEYEFPEAGSRARLGVPMLRDDAVVGVFTLVREEPGHFSPRAIELVRSFADQAVIAIENVRLFDEVQARTRDLEESLAQQTATADVLKVISRSAFDLQTVLDALVESAARICEAEKGCIMQRQGDQYHWVSNFGFSPEHDAYVRAHPMTAGGYSATARVARDRRAVHVPDVLADPDYTASENQRLGNYRTILGVPLLRDGEPIGAFIMTREAVRPFNQRQIDLLQTFADQAVIAIENARLFDEVQAKTRDLEEALQQQTATAEVLQVISRSTFDLEAVFRTLVENAVRLCGARTGMIFQRDGELMHLAASDGATQAFVDYVRGNPIAPGRGTATGRAALEGRTVHILDVEDDPEYSYGGGSLERYRTIVAVTLMRDKTSVGVFTLWRHHVEAFTPRQLALVETFADQAVVAIENARLSTRSRPRRATWRNRSPSRRLRRTCSK